MISLKQLLSLLLLSVSMQYIVAQEEYSNIGGEAASLIFSSGDASPETSYFAQNLNKQLSHAEPVKVKALGKIMQYIIGYNNTIAIPFLNYIFVNDEHLNTLSDQEKKFIIGRCLVYLKEGKMDLILNILFLFTQAYLDYSIMKNNRTLKPINLKINKEIELTPEEVQTKDKVENSVIGSVTMTFLNGILKTLASRSTQYFLDEKTVKQFDCYEGAVKTINSFDTMPNDGTLLGKLSSTVAITSFLTRSPALYLMKHCVPGKLQENSNKLSHIVRNLPLMNRINTFPGSASRITALQKYATQKSQ